MKTALILFFDAWELGIPTSASPYTRVIRVYESMAEALAVYAETPCVWSEIVDFESMEQLLEKANKIEQNLLNGVYNDYM